MLKPIKRIGLIGNPEKLTCARVVREATRLIKRSSRQVFSDVATAQLGKLKSDVCANAAILARKVDLLIVFGGDGTMLRVAREIIGARTPLLGINIGGLGFLTAVSSGELGAALKQVWNGDYRLQSRALIEASCRMRNRAFQQSALNDIVVSRGAIPRLIELDVSVNNEPLTRYRCDGLIVSSPTGSTAYSLAAGGAVVSPTADVFELTPISPHALSNRSLILGFDSQIQIKVVSPRPSTIVSADGQLITELSKGDSITIKRSKHSVRLMHLKGNSFFDTLRAKLRWRGTNL